MILTTLIAGILLQVNFASRYARVLPKGDLRDSALKLMKKGFLVRDGRGVFFLSDNARWLMQGKFGNSILSL